MHVPNTPNLLPEDLLLQLARPMATNLSPTPQAYQSAGNLATDPETDLSTSHTEVAPHPGGEVTPNSTIEAEEEVGDEGNTLAELESPQVCGTGFEQWNNSGSMSAWARG